MKKDVKKLDTILDSIVKNYGNVCFDADELKDIQGKNLSFTLGLDIALQGGAPEGTIITIAGPTMSGKTTLVLTFMAHSMMLDPDKEFYYIDGEHRLNTKLLGTIPNFDQSRLHIIRSAKGAILHAEDLMNIMEDIITNKPNVVLCMDSIASLVPQAASEGKIGESKKLTAVPALLYDFLRRVGPKLAVQKSNLILITHIQDNPTPYGGPKEYGGNAQKYLSSIRLTSYSSKEFPEDSPKKLGRISKFKVIKSALSSGGSEVEFPIFYGRGYYKSYDLVSHGELLGLVDRAGAWYTLEFDDIKHKVQGKDALIEYLESNKEISDKLESKIKQMVFGES